VLSSITVVELEHGLHRAQTAEQAQKRRVYLDAVFAAIPVESFSREMARIAAKVDADARSIGKVIPFADLLIGATALAACGFSRPSAATTCYVSDVLIVM
jgi:tRNA(fMet)-specific endonuclease VapC